MINEIKYKLKAHKYLNTLDKVCDHVAYTMNFYYTKYDADTAVKQLDDLTDYILSYEDPDLIPTTIYFDCNRGSSNDPNQTIEIVYAKGKKEISFMYDLPINNATQVCIGLSEKNNTKLAGAISYRVFAKSIDIFVKAFLDDEPIIMDHVYDGLISPFTRDSIFSVIEELDRRSFVTKDLMRFVSDTLINKLILSESIIIQPYIKIRSIHQISLSWALNGFEYNADIDLKENSIYSSIDLADRRHENDGEVEKIEYTSTPIRVVTITNNLRTFVRHVMDYMTWMPEE